MVERNLFRCDVIAEFVNRIGDPFERSFDQSVSLDLVDIVPFDERNDFREETEISVEVVASGRLPQQARCENR